MNIRRFNPGEEAEIWSLLHDTVHHVNKQDYSPSQLQAWAPHVIDLDKWCKRLQRSQPYVMEIDRQMVGFAELRNTGKIDCFYVHHRWQRKGIGQHLLAHIEDQAHARQLPRLTTFASITAQSFFAHHGFVTEKEQMVILHDTQFKNYLMSKPLELHPLADE